MDELMSSAIKEAIKLPEFENETKKFYGISHSVLMFSLTMWRNIFLEANIYDKSKIHYRVDKFIENCTNKFRDGIDGLSGSGAIDFIFKNLSPVMSNIFLSLVAPAQMGFIYEESIKNKCKKWLGIEPNISALNKSLRGNISSEMGLCIGDLGDILRKNPKLLEYLKSTNNPNFIEVCKNIPNSEEFCSAFTSFLNKYGMRCPGEIDIMNERWIENPLTILPAILSFINAKGKGEHWIDFEKGINEYKVAKEEILITAKNKNLSKKKINYLDNTIELYRTFVALREHQKYANVCIFWIIKKVMLREALTLVEKGILNKVTDIYYLSLVEIKKIIDGTFKENIDAIIEDRKTSFFIHSKLTPPRVLTSDGECFYGSYYNKSIPKNALPGKSVSNGIIEGKARVVLDPQHAHIEPNEILVAPFTDPGWTPLFISSKGLVMEVGGLLTHGAVVAREYGIPAVVGVHDATKLIKTGDFIRLNGTEGYVEILSSK